MHSRVFHISDTNPAQTPVEQMPIDRYYNWNNCDYVDPIHDADLNNEIREWLGGRPGIKVDAEKRTLTITSKREALRPYFDDWRKKMQEALDKPFDEWIDSAFCYDWYRACESYSTEGGIWFDDNDEKFGRHTMQDFLRNVSDGDVFYIMGALDYHY